MSGGGKTLTFLFIFMSSTLEKKSCGLGANSLTRNEADLLIKESCQCTFRSISQSFAAPYFQLFSVFGILFTRNINYIRPLRKGRLGDRRKSTLLKHLAYVQDRTLIRFKLLLISIKKCPHS